MKALLIAVIIILIILIIIIFFLNKKTNKVIIKEAFYDDIGDIYSLQTGEILSNSMNKVEADVNGIIIKQEENDRDFLLLQNDYKNNFSNLNTSINQYTLDTSSKISDIQNTNNLQDISINTIKRNINDYDNRFKSMNDDITVIDGRLVSLTNIQQEQLNNLQNNVKKLSTQQSNLKDSVYIQNQNIQNNVDSEFYLLKNKVTNSFSQQEGIINNTNNQVNTLSTDFTSFKTNKINTDNSQQTSLNNINSQISSLNNTITDTQHNISDISSLFKNYIKTDQLNNFALKSDLSVYATKLDEEKYVTKSDLINYVSEPELMKYMKQSDIQNAINVINNLINTTNKTLQDNINNINTSLNSKITNIDNMNNIIDGRITVLESRNIMPENINNSVKSTPQNQLMIDNHTKQIIAAEGKINNITLSLNDTKNDIITINKNILPIQTSLTTLQALVTTLQNSQGTLQTSLGNYYNKTETDSKIDAKFKSNTQSSSSSSVSSEQFNTLNNLFVKLKSQVDQIQTLSSNITKNNITVGDNENGIKLFANNIIGNNLVNNDISFGNNYNGGIESSSGIGFRNKSSSKTTFMHDTTSGNTWSTGTLSSININANDTITANKKLCIGKKCIVENEFSISGPPGPQGIQGLKGIDGTSGQPGPIGPPGLPGSKGADGLQGPKGIDGISGKTGQMGPFGPKGSDGPQGIEGKPGPMGPRGSDGPRGADGSQVSNGVRIENNGLSIGGKGKLSVDAPNISGGRLLVDDDGMVFHNNIKFSNKWSGYPDNSKNQSEISNDTNDFKSLMIVGNKSGGGERRVSIFDTLNVNGTLNVTGNTNINNTIYHQKGDPGAMLERNYGKNSDRYGMGQFPNGTTRLYASSTYNPASINLGFAKDGVNEFNDVLKITNDSKTTLNGNLQVNGDTRTNSIGRDGGDWFRLYGTANNGTAVYNGMSINDNGGLSIGLWDRAPPGKLCIGRTCIDENALKNIAGNTRR